MKVSRRIILPILVLMIGTVWCFFFRQHSDQNLPEEVAEEQAPTDIAKTPAQQPVTLMAVASEAARLNSDTTKVEEDLAIIDTVLTFYRRLYGANPVGLNREIVRTLTGENQKRAAFIDPDHPAINVKGELLDRWGTPFFFHQQSAKEMEIISAGPDRQLWTDDDSKSH